MIDVKLLRSNSKIFYDSCRARGFDTKVLDEFFTIDSKWKENLKAINDYKHEKNTISLDISRMVKAGNDETGKLKNSVREINEKISSIEQEQKIIESRRDELIHLIPNLLADDVPALYC